MTIAHGPASTGAPTSARPSALPAWAPLAAIVLLGAALRFATLGRQSLWFDEAATWQLTQLPFGEMLSALPDGESNPPLFYVLEWLVTRAFGDGEAALRLLPAIAGTALVWVAFAIGRRVGGQRVGLAAAALTAVNPMLVWFSQEARSYALVALLSAIGLLLFLRALDDDRPALLAWWAAASALACCTHYFAAFAVLPQVAWLAWRHPRPRAVAAATGALVLVGAALLPLLLAQSDNPYDIAAESLLTRAVQLPKQFLLGYRGPLALPLGLLGAGLVALALTLLLRRAQQRVRERALLVGGVGVVALAIALAAALAGADYVNARNLIPALVPLLVAPAAGFAVDGPASGRRVGAGLAGLLALCAISLAIVVAVAADRQYQRPDWRGLAEAIGPAEEPRALVVSPANGQAVLRYYLPGLAPLPTGGAALRQADVVTVAGSQRPGEAPRLPSPTRLTYPEGAFGTPQERRSPTWAILRFRVPDAFVVGPLPLTAVRFSAEMPSVMLQSPGG